MYIRLPFEMAPTGDMFQRKIDEVFHELTNVLSIADYNIIAALNPLVFYTSLSALVFYMTCGLDHFRVLSN